MKSQSPRSIALYLGVVFAISLMIGATTGYTLAKRSPPPQLPPAQKFEDGWLAKYRAELALTEEQAQAVQPLLRKPVEDLSAIWYRAIMTMGAVQESVDRRIEPLLDEQQREKLGAWIKKNRERRLYIARERFSEDPGKQDHIYYAAAIGDHDAILRYLQAGVDINQRGLAFGMTPLAVAAMHGQAGTVDLLIREGADVNARHPDGNTALHVAAFFGRLEPVERLIAAGADIHARNEEGKTALEGMAADMETIEFIGAILLVQIDKEKTLIGREAVEQLLGRPYGERRDGSSDVPAPLHRSGNLDVPIE
jgi:hypothetical protein